MLSYVNEKHHLCQACLLIGLSYGQLNFHYVRLSTWLVHFYAYSIRGNCAFYRVLLECDYHSRLNIMLLKQPSKITSLGLLLSMCLKFFHFQPSVAYKSVSYKKKRVNNCSFCKVDLYTGGLCMGKHDISFECLPPSYQPKRCRDISIWGFRSRKYRGCYQEGYNVRFN